MAIYSGFSHAKWWCSIAMLNYQRVFYMSFPHVLCPWHCQSNPIEVYIPVELWVKAFGLPDYPFDVLRHFYLSSTRNAPRISQMKLTLEWHRAFGPERNDCQDPQPNTGKYIYIFQGATMTHPLRMGDRCCLHAPTCLQVSAFFGGEGGITLILWFLCSFLGQAHRKNLPQVFNLGIQ